MAIRSVPPTAHETPVIDPLKLLTTELEEKYCLPQTIVVCSHSNHSGARQGKAEYAYGNGMVSFAADLFKELQKSAFSGKTSLQLSIGVDSSKTDSDRANVLVVFRVFQSKTTLFINDLTELGRGSHHPFCNLYTNQIYVNVRWNAQDSYLNPKPTFSLETPKPWGFALLNEKRQRKEGTDCTLIFGGKDSFPAHKLVVSSFSPFFENLARSTMKDGASGIFEFPNIKDFTPLDLERFMSFMYTQTLKLDSFETAIRFLDWSFILQSEPLGQVAFQHISGAAEKMSDQDILDLLFVESQHSFKELKTLCQWLLKTKPQFYESLLNAKETASEDFLKLITISKHDSIQALRELFRKHWDDLETKEKVVFVHAALESQHLSLLSEMEKLCKSACKKIASDDPYGKKFAEAYAAVNQRMFQWRTNFTQNKLLP